MKTNRVIAGLTALAVLCAVASVNGVARASIAYGSINNFDTVNDTSNVCHVLKLNWTTFTARTSPTHTITTTTARR